MLGDLRNVVDMEVIRDARLKLGVDPLGGRLHTGNIVKLQSERGGEIQIDQR